MENDGFILIEGIHKNPNNINTLDEQTKIIHGPYNKKEAEKVANRLAEWTENYGASSWNNRYRDSFVLMGQVKAQHIKS